MGGWGGMWGMMFVWVHKCMRMESRILDNFVSKCPVKVCCDFNIFVRKYQDAVAQKVIEFN